MIRPARARNRVAVARMRPPLAAENRYVRALRGVLGSIGAEYTRRLAPVIEARAGKRRDAAEHEEVLDVLGVEVRAVIREPVTRAFDAMANAVVRQNKGAMQLGGGLHGMGAGDVGLHQAMATIRDRNVRLVEDAARDYASQVRDIFTGPETADLSVGELTDLLRERASVSQSRAELIARDQTLKTSAGVNQVRQRNAGVDRYTWSGTLDDRERETHRALEGAILSWDAPPVTNDAGDRNHPGEDYQCRCIAIPYFGGGEEE